MIYLIYSILAMKKRKMKPDTPARPQLGFGIYSVPDIALILHLPAGKVRRWLGEYWDEVFTQQTSHKYSWGKGREKAVNFYTLIEFYSFYRLRELGLSAQSIKKVHALMTEKLNTPLPFATHALLSDGQEVLFRHDSAVVHADKSFQLKFEKIIEPFYTKIDFDTAHLAQRFWPDGKESAVVVDPHHQFGQPVISGTNIRIDTLWTYYKAGERIDTIASLYELSEQQVLDAIRFFEKSAA